MNTSPKIMGKDRQDKDYRKNQKAKWLNSPYDSLAHTVSPQCGVHRLYVTFRFTVDSP